MIRIPWLNLDYIGASHLLTPSVDVDSGLNDLSSVSTDISGNPQLCNLVKTYTYHKEKLDMEIVSPQQMSQENRIVNELYQTLKTIMRV